MQKLRQQRPYHQRTSTKDLLEAGALAPGLYVQACTITGVTFHHDLTATFQTRRKKFAVYTIRVHSHNSRGPRTVEHRFSAFRNLHRNLKKLKNHHTLLKGLRFPTKFTFSHSTSARITRERTISLENYLTTVLSRVPIDRVAAAIDPACVYLREFLLLRSFDPTLTVRAASEAFSAQNATGLESGDQWKNPLESTQNMSNKLKSLTGQTCTQLLSNELLKVVRNDSRKNGITSQIAAFHKYVRQEYDRGSPREAVEKSLAQSSLVERSSLPSTESKSKKQHFRTLRSQRSTLSMSDSRALDRAIEAQEKKAKRRSNACQKSTVAEVVAAVEAKVFESRLQRVCHFAENLYDLLLSTHLDRLMLLLPLTDEQRRKKYEKATMAAAAAAEKGNVQEHTESSVGGVWVVVDDVDNDGNDGNDDVEIEEMDPREELVKHIVEEMVEISIYTPLFDMLKLYATKLESTTELDTKIISNISALHQFYQITDQESSKLPQSVFHVNFLSPTNWDDAVSKLLRIKESKSPTHMLVGVLSTVHSIHNTYYNESKEMLKQIPGKMDKEPDPLGADDFLPIFVYVTARANLPHPQTTFQMIAHLANRDRLEGLAKYFLTVFESALWFLAHNNFAEERITMDKNIIDVTENSNGENGIGKEEIEIKIERLGAVMPIATVTVEQDESNKGGSQSIPNIESSIEGGSVGEEEEEEDIEENGEHLLWLERRMSRMSARLKALERLIQLNGMSILSSERRGSTEFMSSLTPLIRHARTVSEEVVEARLTFGALNMM